MAPTPPPPHAARLHIILERLAIGMQYVLPQHLLSRLVGRATRLRHPAWKDFLIRRLILRHGIELDEMEATDFSAWPDFNAFFTRALKPGARPQPEDPEAISSPSDGRVSQAGAIRGGRILQAKQQAFSASELLGEEETPEHYVDGQFLTVYLAPGDYHRVHMPLAGELVETVYIPGRLFSVAPFAVAAIPRIYARNERLVCHFRSARGPFTIVLVGAMLVSGIETTWGNGEAPPDPKAMTRRNWRGRNVRLARGDELGRFNMGSTVITLLPANVGRFDAELSPGQALRVGEAIGRMRTSRSDES